MKPVYVFITIFLTTVTGWAVGEGVFGAAAISALTSVVIALDGIRQSIVEAIERKN